MISLSGRVVVISPHIDDAALSLGATIHRAAEEGSVVEILSVFAGDPRSDAPAGDWDRRCGFTTQGEASTARRDEDVRACKILGAAPSWLSLPDDQYERSLDTDAICRSVIAHVGTPQLVLLPGAPLSHPDHRWIADVLARALRGTRLAYYVEQPYALRASWNGDVSTQTMPHATELRWEVAPVRWRDLVSKFEAISSYTSQLEVMGLGGRGKIDLLGHLWRERRAGGERIASGLSSR